MVLWTTGSPAAGPTAVTPASPFPSLRSLEGRQALATGSLVLSGPPRDWHSKRSLEGRKDGVLVATVGSVDVCFVDLGHHVYFWKCFNQPAQRSACMWLESKGRAERD